MGAAMYEITSADLLMVKREVAREDLRIYSVVVMAGLDLDAGKVESALARLRVDADKLRCYDSPLNELLKRVAQ
jgi:hypothetical protein